MPNFAARFTAGATSVTWEDADTPSRINPKPDHPHRRFTGTVGVAVTFKATVGGVEGEIDSNLGGKLFEAWWIEHPGDPIASSPGGPGPTFSNPAGQSSVQSFTPQKTGHHTIGFRREDGGAFVLHLDVPA